MSKANTLPINFALFARSARDDRFALGIVAFGVATFAFLVLQAFAAFGQEFLGNVFDVPVLASFLRGLIGEDLADSFSADAAVGLLFVHPVILAVSWTYLVSYATRVLVAEVDQGTADLLLSLPVSRWQIYLSVTTWPIVSITIIAMSIWAGAWLGTLVADMPASAQFAEMGRIAINSAACLFAVAGIATMISAFSERRSRTGGVIAAILVVSFMLNSLAAFWKPAQLFAYVSILNYFKPLSILRNEAIAWSNIFVLIAVAMATWSIGAVIFVRRDIPTN